MFLYNEMKVFLEQSSCTELELLSEASSELVLVLCLQRSAKYYFPPTLEQDFP